MFDLKSQEWMRPFGTLTSVSGKLCATLNASIGEVVEVAASDRSCVLCEVIGFDNNSVQLMPFRSTSRFRAGNRVFSTGQRMKARVGDKLLGRVLDALGSPMDDGPAIQPQEEIELHMDTPDPMSRSHIVEPFVTGIRAIDGVLTLGKGQRVGLFAGSGVGKSTLLGEITKYASADINVIVLVGERGREVRPFVEGILGSAGLAKSVVIVSTSDQPPIARIRACELGTAIATWFRDQGRDVLFVLDSLTRMAYAQRELGLSLGEPPTSRGYTPSVFQRMAELLEHLGNNERGSITALLTVLVDGDDMNDPVADSARSILDGHVVLSRDLARAGHFPAIDVLQSASRLLNEVNSEATLSDITTVRAMLAKYREVEDLIQIGAYQPGHSEVTDQAVKMYPRIMEFLKQGLNSPHGLTATQNLLGKLARSEP